MDFEVYDFRNALAILSAIPAWQEVQDVVTSVAMTDVLAAQAAIAAERAGRPRPKKAPAGAQTSVNVVIRERFLDQGWQKEPRLFDKGPKRDLAGWKMDFLKDEIGVEVSFNHAEAMAWTLVRLNLAGEVPEIRSSKIRVGVAIYPTKAFKTWGKMDSAVGVYDRACLWLEKMKPVLPIPIAVLGLDPKWPPTNAFRGTAKS